MGDRTHLPGLERARACSALMVGPDTVNVKQEPGGHGQPKVEKSELVLPTGLPKLNDALLIKK